MSNLLSVAGYDVQREYYINDAGRQMEILGVSTWLRYLEQLGESFTFPSNGYRGDYLLPLATDVPRIEIGHMESPSPLNPLGVKGAGEGGTLPAIAAVAGTDNTTQCKSKTGHCSPTSCGVP